MVVYQRVNGVFLALNDEFLAWLAILSGLSSNFEEFIFFPSTTGFPVSCKSSFQRVVRK
jgi:hypothetical protein